ncbi:unnamed protein product, partial [Prorocentrum cordatum]
MFNASLASPAGLGGVEAGQVVLPRPAQARLRHLHSFLWHTAYGALPGGAPVPVALQPPGAVPHLVEHHHQRGRLLASRTCDTVRVEGMLVNWTFHRLGGSGPGEGSAGQSPARGGLAAGAAAAGAGEAPAPAADDARASSSDFLHCWARPERYFLALEAQLAAAERAPAEELQGWDALLSASSDCPCHGAFGCRSGSGACVARLASGEACPAGSGACPEVPPALEPAGKPAFAAPPEVCAFAYHRRAASAGAVEAMHVLSHAYSNGIRGVPTDAAEFSLLPPSRGAAGRWRRGTPADASMWLTRWNSGWARTRTRSGPTQCTATFCRRPTPRAPSWPPRSRRRSRCSRPPGATSPAGCSAAGSTGGAPRGPRAARPPRPRGS